MLLIKKIYGGGGLIAQSCPILCDPVDCSSSDSLVHGILQARILEWVAAGVQPWWIHGIRSGDGVGEDQETTA